MSILFQPISKNETIILIFLTTSFLDPFTSNYIGVHFFLLLSFIFLSPLGDRSTIAKMVGKTPFEETAEMFHENLRIS